MCSRFNQPFHPSFLFPFISHLKIPSVSFSFFLSFLDSFPSSLPLLSHLEISYTSDFNINLISLLPSTLNCLKLPGKNLEDVKLPSNLNSLIIAHDCEKIPPLPSSLHRLFFENPMYPVLDSKIINYQFSFPPNLTHLSLPDKFNQPLPLLPSSLSHLKLGWDFNQIVDHILPANLSHLHFSGEFNKEVNHLPSSLQHLILGYEFTNRLVNIFYFILLYLHCIYCYTD